MTTQELIAWLKGENASGWVFGTIMFALTASHYVYQYLNRKKPNIILCKETNKVSLIKVSKRISEKTLVSYNKLEVKNLSLAGFDIYNIGTEVVKNIKIGIEFDNNTKILDIDTIKTSDVSYRKLTSNNVTQLNIPYLNPYKDHGSKVMINIVCDGSIDGIKISGGGEGWSIKHEKSISATQTRWRIFIVTLLLIGEVLILTRFNAPKSWELIDSISIAVLSLTYVLGFAWALPIKSERFQQIIGDLYEFFDKTINVNKLK